MPTITTVNPATEKDIKTYNIMSEAESTDKIEACHAAFLEWLKLSHEDRAPYLKNIGQTLRNNAHELAALMTNETGKLSQDGHIEVKICAAIFDYTAQYSPELPADEECTHGADQKRGIVSYRPLGVIYSIQSWNFPFYQPIRVLADNLMAGNDCVIEHASICTGSGLRLCELCI